MKLTGSANGDGHAAIEHPLGGDPRRSNVQNAAPSAVPKRRGSRRGGNNEECTLSIAQSTTQQSQQNQQPSTISDAKQKQPQRLPRSVRWRLSLGLLAKPTTDSTDKDTLLKSVEETCNSKPSRIV